MLVESQFCCCYRSAHIPSNGVSGWFCHDLKHQKDQQSRNRADPAANCVVDPGEGQEFEFVLKSDVVVVVSRHGQIRTLTQSVIIAPS